MFDNTRLVTFDEKIYDKILAINSQEGERVELDEPVNAQVRLELMCTPWQSLGIHYQMPVGIFLQFVSQSIFWYGLLLFVYSSVSVPYLSLQLVAEFECPFFFFFLCLVFN